MSASREADDDIEMDKADSPRRGAGGMTLGCVRGLAAPTAVAEAHTSTVKPMSVKAGLMSSVVTVLWHDISVYRASGARRLAGPTYE